MADSTPEETGGRSTETGGRRTETGNQGREVGERRIHPPSSVLSPLSSDQRGRRVREIFDAAIELEPDPRREYLDVQCGADPDLRAQVDELLAHDSHQTEAFLHSPLSRAAEVKIRLPSGGLVGDKYRVIEHLSDGGMGEVYLCEQERPVRRRVALKLIKPGMDSREVLARFEQERQTLALLNHPNVATVFDAGMTETGRPYFVMEYVDGRSVARYCDEHHLSVLARLKIFLEICDAVQHAHQKGVIHRDLKPSNVLMAQSNGTPCPKVIDFGVAKALSDQSAPGAQTIIGQFIGTPAYMSPEQAAGQPVDTRTDVYSLGVLLFELLTGSTPLDMESKGSSSLEEILRSIREEQTIRPSTRIRSEDEQDATASATSRASDRHGLIRALRGDLDWITLKATAKETDRRYESVTDFAEDIRRHLRHLPVSAGPPGMGYVLGKFVRRNRTAVAGLTAVFAVLLAGIVATGLALREAQQQREDAQRQRDLARWQAYVATIAAADSAVRQHDILNARARLDAADPELRNWEWHYLLAQLDQSTRTIDSTGSIHSAISFSPDGRRIACRGQYNRTEIRDTVTGELLAQYSGHDGSISDFTFAPDGNAVVSASGTEVHLWDSRTANLIRSFEGHRRAVTLVDISEDGEWLVTAGDDATVRIWDIRSGRTVRVLGELASPVYCVKLSHDGTRVAAGYRDEVIFVWDVPSAAIVQRFRAEMGHVAAVAFSPDDRVLLSGGGDRTVRTWDLTTGEPIAVLRGHTGSVNEVAFSPDGSRIASASEDRTVRFWDALTGAPLTVQVGSQASIVAMDWTNDGTTIATAAAPGPVRLWDASAEPVHRTLERIPNLGTAIVRFADVAISPDGHLIAACSNHGVLMWSRGSHRLLAVLRQNARPYQVEFCPDGSRIAVVYPGSVRLHDTITFAVTAEFEFDEHATDIQFLDAGGDTLAIGAERQGILLWEPDSGRPPRALPGIDGTPGVLIASRNGNALAATFDRRKIGVADVNSSEARILECPSDVYGMAFYDQGRRLVTGSRDRIVRVWAVDRGEVEREYEFPEIPGRLLFNADESRLFIARIDGAISVHAWPTGEELMVLRKYANQVRLALPPDERLLIAASTDGAIGLWQSDPVARLHEARLEYDQTYDEMSNLVVELAETIPDVAKLASALEHRTDLTPWQQTVARHVLLHRFAGVKPPDTSGLMDAAPSDATTSSTDGTRPNDS